MDIMEEDNNTKSGAGGGIHSLADFEALHSEVVQRSTPEQRGQADNAWEAFHGSMRTALPPIPAVPPLPRVAGGETENSASTAMSRGSANASKALPWCP